MIRKLLLTVAASAPIFAAQAQISSDTNDQTLNEVVITENRLQLPVTGQNRNVYILDKEQIKTLPVQSVNELLSYVSGVDVRQRGPWGAQTDISIDGGTFEQTIILLNGVKMVDPQTGHNTMNLPVSIGIIERIEVLKGSAARIYGINSLTGAINIVTVKPNRTGIEAQVNTGTNFKDNEENPDKIYSSKGIQIAGSYADENQNHLLSGDLQSGSGHRYNTAFKNHKLFYQGNVQLSPRERLSIMAGYIYNNFGANGYYAAPIDKEALEIVQTGIGSVTYSNQVNDRLSISPRINYRYNYDDYRFYRNDLATARNQHYTHVLSPELNANYRTDFGDFGFGAEARFEKINSSNIGDHTRKNVGIYAEFGTEQIKDFQINAGAYVNYNSAFGWQVYPGLDLGYSINSYWNLYVNTGTGQRIPSLTDLYYDTPSNVGNENLEAEKSWYAEGGIKYNNDKVRMNASYFHRSVDDFIDWVRLNEEQPWRSENFLKNTVNGLNMSIDYRSQLNRINLMTGLSYTYLDPVLESKDPESNLSKYAIESLRHQLVAKATLGYEGFNVTLTERFQERINYKSYFITDARVSYHWRSYAIFANASNLFDTEYIEVAATPMPGRWYNLGIKVSL